MKWAIDHLPPPGYAIAVNGVVQTGRSTDFIYGLGKLFCERMFCSKNGLKPVSYSVFYDEPEKLS
jgi:hypothetical protein